MVADVTRVARTAIIGRKMGTVKLKLKQDEGFIIWEKRQARRTLAFILPLQMFKRNTEGYLTV